MTCVRMATPKSGQRSFSVDAARLALAMAEMLTPAYGAPSLELLDESRETAVGVRVGAIGKSTAHTKASHAPAADALHCVRLQSRRAHGNTSALARTAGRSCSNYAQCVWACACRGWLSGNIEADDVGWSDIDEARAGMSSLA